MIVTAKSPKAIDLERRRAAHRAEWASVHRIVDTRKGSHIAALEITLAEAIPFLPPDLADRARALVEC